MKHALVIVGEELQINAPFLTYIFRSYEKKFGELAMVYYIDDNDIELPFKIEKYSKAHEFISIVSNENNFYTIGKILSTLTNDTFELKSNTLMPSRVKKFVENSFVCELNKASLNLLKGTPTKELPPFLCEFTTQNISFNLINIDLKSAKIFLDPLETTYNVNIKLTQLAANLIFVRVVAKKYGQIDSFMENIENLLPKKVIQNPNIIEFVAKKLIEKNLTITFAESCTAGMCAALLGGVSGISDAFIGSVITYSNHVKHTWLDVSDEILNEKGAVSAECVEQMCKGAMELCKSDFAIAISGIAGPSGGSDEKPVGTVFIGVCDKDKVVVEKFNLSGDRNYIRKQSAINAYVMLLVNFINQL